MNSYFRYFRGYLQIRIRGYGATRFMNICSQKGIRLWDIVKEEDGYCLCMAISDFRKIAYIVRKVKIKVAIVSKHGLPFFFAGISYRKCFVIGALFCFLWLFYMNRFIWAIETEGNYSITDEMIFDYLKENQIEIGTKISQVDSVSLERLFREKFPDITWISIGREGTALTIEIKERDVTLYEEEEYASSSLYAPCDGIVLSIVVRSGLACVKAGDEVKAGQLIVDGVLPVVKTDGTVLGYRLVNADADILFGYVREYKDEISLYTEEKAYTGNVNRESYLRFGNHTMQFQWFPNPYKQYEFTQTFHQIELWEHFYLPIWIGSGEYKEYEWIRTKPPQAVLEEQLYSNLSFFLKTLEEKGVQNIKKDVKISTSGSRLILSGELTFTDSNILREEINTYTGTELENGQYYSADNGNEH